MPQRRGGSSVGVESVDTIVFGGDEENVVFAFAWDFDIRKIERLGVDVAVHFQGKELAELGGIDVCRSENFFGDGRAGPGIVILRSKHLSRERRGQQK